MRDRSCRRRGAPKPKTPATLSDRSREDCGKVHDNAGVNEFGEVAVTNSA